MGEGEQAEAFTCDESTRREEGGITSVKEEGMRYFSTFSGIGGFELGIIQAHGNQVSVRDRKTETSKRDESQQSMESTSTSYKPRRDSTDNISSGDSGSLLCVGFSEIDKYATEIYQKHFPDHKNYGDITKINAEELPDFDLLVGGFPCQAFSIAGKRKGFDDTRGTLFFDLARILRAKQPRLFVFENVKGLLSHDNGRTFTTIISTLDELGYDLQWQVLNSKNHGVPQNRERIIIVGHLRGTPRPEVFPFGEDGREITDVQGHVANTLTARYHGAEATGTYVEEGELNAQIQQLNNPKHSNDRVYGTDGVSPTLNTMQGGMRQPFVAIPEATKKGYAEAHVGQSINLSVIGSATPRGRVSDVAQTLDTGMQQHTLTEDMRIRRLTPVECERLQGFPDGWTESVSDTQRYKTLGNAVTVNVIRDVMQKLNSLS